MTLSAGNAHDDLEQRRALPTLVRLFLAADLGIIVLVVGLVTVAHSLGIGGGEEDRTTAQFVWGGLAAAAGFLVLGYVTVRAALVTRGTGPRTG